MKPVLLGKGLLPKIEHGSGDKILANSSAKLSQGAKINLGYQPGGLYLKGYYCAVITLQNKIDFASVTRAPMTGGHCLRQSGYLF